MVAPAAPERVLMNKSQLSRLIDVSRPTMNKHLDRPGSPQPNADGLYDAMKVAAFVGQRQALDNNVGNAALESAKLLGHKLDNERKQMEMDKERGTYANKQESMTWISEQFGILRSRLMSVVPTVSRQLVGKNVRQIDKILNKRMVDALNQFGREHLTAAGVVPQKKKAAPKVKRAKPKPKPKKKKTQKKKGGRK